MEHLSRWYHVLTRGIVYVLAFAVPLAYLPWTFDPLEVNKQTIVIIGVVLAMLLWCAAAVTERRMQLRKDGIFLLLGLFVLAVLVSAGLSASPYLSFVGQTGDEYTSVLSLVVFGLLFFIVAHTLTATSAQRVLWSATVLSGSAVALVTLPRFLGISLLDGATSLAGAAPTTWAFVLLVFSILGSGLWLTSRDHGERDVLPTGVWGVLVRGAHLVTMVVTLLALMAIDSKPLWALAVLGTGVLFAFALVRAHEFPHFGRFVLPMLLCVAGLVFFFVPTFIGSPFLPEVSPTHTASWNIATATLSDEGWLFGSAPGTYLFDYTKHYAGAVNATDFWDIKFDRASSYMLTLLPTIGVVGTTLYLAFLLALALAALSRLAKEKQHDEWKMTFVPFAAWLVLVAGQFLMPSTMTLQTLFWLLSGVLAAQGLRDAVTVDATRSPRAGMAVAFGVVLLLVALVVTMFVTLSRYGAEVAFARAVAADRAGAPIDDVIIDLDNAALRNRWSDVYYRNLGHALLLKTAELLDDPAADPSVVQGLLGASVNAARRATSLSPKNVANWSLQGDIYRELVPVLSNADVFALAAYTEAVALAPQNPKYLVSLARGYIARADLATRLRESDDVTQAEAAEAARDEALARAATALMQAQTLKTDYETARYYLALVYERQGKLADAIKSMEVLRDNSPFDVGVSMQLSLLYLRQGKNDLAKAELLRALTIEPNYANARWYLASVYQQEGDFAAAIAEIKAVQALNPDNATVAQRLEQLNQGLVESQVPEPIVEDETVDAEVENTTASSE